MTICTIIGATILNCSSVAPLPPAAAVTVLTSHTSPWVAPPPMPTPYEWATRNAPAPPRNPNSPFLTPATPIAPLAPPWSYTTYYGRNFAVTRSNVRPAGVAPHRGHGRP
jgi:hypothetical protein